jgi:hypothetical protein
VIDSGKKESIADYQAKVIGSGAGGLSSSPFLAKQGFQSDNSRIKSQ